MAKPVIIGISGKVGSGKDTLGGYIQEFAQEQGYTVYRRGFGDALKEEVAKYLNDTSFAEILDFLDRHATTQAADDILLDTFVCKPSNVWESLKTFAGWWSVEDYRGQYDEVLASMHDRTRKEKFRRLMQWWGTEFRRNQCNQDYWVDMLTHWVSAFCKVHEGEKLLIWVPDDRFISEQKRLEALGAFTIRINRPSAEANTPEIVRNHPSETELDNYPLFHATMNNEDITLEEVRHGSFALWNRALVYTNGSAPS